MSPTTETIVLSADKFERFREVEGRLVHSIMSAGNSFYFSEPKRVVQVVQIETMVFVQYDDNTWQYDTELMLTIEK